MITTAAAAADVADAITAQASVNEGNKTAVDKNYQRVHGQNLPKPYF